MERAELDAPVDLLAERLRRFGELPVDDDVVAAHLAAMRAVTPAIRRRRHLVLAAGAATVAVMAGTVGLAAADLLPDPAQRVAHDVLGSLGVDVPDRGRGACVSDLAVNDDPPEQGGHGDLVSQAAREGCAPEEQPATEGTVDGDLQREGLPDGVTAGPPTTVPVGPPGGVAGGRPDGVPPGPPDEVPAGQGTPPDPAGPPADVPNDPPDGVPPGPPTTVPNRPPDVDPPGPPTTVPNGPPGGLPPGPPVGTPHGPPDGIPNGRG